MSTLRFLAVLAFASAIMVACEEPVIPHQPSPPKAAENAEPEPGQAEPSNPAQAEPSQPSTPTQAPAIDPLTIEPPVTSDPVVQGVTESPLKLGIVAYNPEEIKVQLPADIPGTGPWTVEIKVFTASGPNVGNRRIVTKEVGQDEGGDVISFEQDVDPVEFTLKDTILYVRGYYETSSPGSTSYVTTYGGHLQREVVCPYHWRESTNTRKFPWGLSVGAVQVGSTRKMVASWPVGSPRSGQVTYNGEDVYYTVKWGSAQADVSTHNLVDDRIGKHRSIGRPNQWVGVQGHLDWYTSDGAKRTCSRDMRTRRAPP